MAWSSEDRDRQVVPRWRSFQATVRHGELVPLKPPQNPNDWSGTLDGLIQDWTDRKGVSTAADLVSAAFVTGQEAKASGAARFLLYQDSVPYGAKAIAAICLKNVGETGSTIEAAIPPPEYDAPPTIIHSPNGRVFQVQIHAARELLADYPRNPVLWTNLARLYTSAGSQEKAAQAMRVALALASENRFILRSAARLMLHQGDGRQALWLLRGAQCLEHDPWVLSAEIATAAALGRPSQHIKRGRRMLDAARFSPLQISELASAIGTLEAVTGNRKSSRLLISQSLRQPSENAVAQAAWLARKVGVIASAAIDVSRSAEASAWQAFREANWNRSLEEAIAWRDDQPFSSRPALHGSHLASTILENQELAIEFAQFGLLSNPDDAPLHNNLAFALAQQGRAQEADKVLSRIKPNTLSAEQFVYVAATLGLIAFRSGRPDQGRLLYRQALQVVRARKIENGELANVYLAFEELRIGSPHAEEIRREAIDGATHLTEPWCQLVVDRLRRFQAPTSQPS